MNLAHITLMEHGKTDYFMERASTSGKMGSIMWAGIVTGLKMAMGSSGSKMAPYTRANG